jgi:glyoxylase-like metal-dependent hydrolase (beta-lactamase superfamily II)
VDWHIYDGTIGVRKLCVGPLENNVYVVACDRTRSAVIVDAADEPERVLEAATGLDIQAILTTHRHADHHAAADEVRRALGTPFRIHPDDAVGGVPSVSAPIADGEVIGFGDVKLQAIHTPGHTPGSTCFFGHGLLFSGDTLFPGGPGATNKPDDFAIIMASLHERLFTLGDDTVVLPGHGLDTTIGAERPHLSEWEERGW